MISVVNMASTIGNFTTINQTDGDIYTPTMAFYNGDLSGGRKIYQQSRTARGFMNIDP
jgi:hypothetical protein